MYKVKPESTEGKVRVLHRNLLLLCHFLEKPPTNAENTSNNRNRRKRYGKPLHATDETKNELREPDTNEDYPEIPIKECRPVEPEPQEPVTAPDEDNDGETPDDDPELTNVIDEDEAEHEGGEGLHNNEVLNENIPAQNEATGNDDQLRHDQNFADPRERPQRMKQPPVRFGYNQPGNPSLFCQAINTDTQPWQMTPYSSVPPQPWQMTPYPSFPRTNMQPGQMTPYSSIPPQPWLMTSYPSFPLTNMQSGQMTPYSSIPPQPWQMTSYPSFPLTNMQPGQMTPYSSVPPQPWQMTPYPSFPLTNMQPCQMGPHSPLPPAYVWSQMVQRPWQTFQPFYPVAQVGML